MKKIKNLSTNLSLRSILILATIALAGCALNRQDRAVEEYPQSYFDSLPDVPVPASPYTDKDQTYWFAIGYREGWERGQSGVVVSTFPPFPQHPACINNPALFGAQRNGFEMGFDTSFKISWEKTMQHLNHNNSN